MKRVLTLFAALAITACSEAVPTEVDPETGEVTTIENRYLEKVSEIRYGADVFIFRDPEGCDYVLLIDTDAVAVTPRLNKDGEIMCTGD